MRTIPTLTTIAAVVLAACTPMRHGGETDDISANTNRRILVSVVNGQIDLFPDPVLVGAGNGKVKWMFDAEEADHVFPADAVTFGDAPAAPPSTAGCLSVANAASAARRFNNCGPKKQGAEFHCNSVGQAPPVGTCYYYELKVVPTAGGPAIVKDPWAKNR